MSTKPHEADVDDALEDLPGDAEDIDPPVRPAANEPEHPVEAKQDGKAPSWMEGVDEDTKAWLASKGWKSPADMVKSAREAESALGRERSRADKAERDAQELAQMYERVSQAVTGKGPTQDAEDRYQIQQLGELMEAGEVSAAQAFKYLTDEVVPDLIRQHAGQLIQPVAQKTEMRDLRDTAAELESTYPDFRELSEDVISLMRREPDEYRGAKGMRRAYAMIKADRDAKAAREAKNTQRAETLDRGSLGNDLRSAEQAIRERIAGASRHFDDGI